MRKKLKAKLFYSLFPKGTIPPDMLTFQALKYFPYKHGQGNYVLPKDKDPNVELGPEGLPVPPVELRLGYAADTKEFVSQAQSQVEEMLSALKRAGLSLDECKRVLDFGCGSGRMIRQMIAMAPNSELWGVDISAEHIHWAERHLSPPINFAITTTIPHLPFEDRYFNLIYAGSVFTHIEDTTKAWLLELARILAPGGYVYVTISDDSTQRLLEPEYIENELPAVIQRTGEKREGQKQFSKSLQNHPFYQKHKSSNFGTLVIGRDASSNVFYGPGEFSRLASPMFKTVEIIAEAYAFQTGVVLQRV